MSKINYFVEIIHIDEVDKNITMSDIPYFCANMNTVIKFISKQLVEYVSKIVMFSTDSYHHTDYINEIHMCVDLMDLFVYNKKYNTGLFNHILFTWKVYSYHEDMFKPHFTQDDEK